LIGQRVYGQSQLTMVAGQIKFERRGILKWSVI
jgi:dihydroorotase